MSSNDNQFLAGVLRGYRRVLGDAVPDDPAIPADGDGLDHERVHLMLTLTFEQVRRFADRANAWGELRRDLPDVSVRDNAMRVYRVANALEAAAMASRRKFDEQYRGQIPPEKQASRSRLARQVELAKTLKILSRATSDFAKIPDPEKTGMHFGEMAAHARLPFEEIWLRLVAAR